MNIVNKPAASRPEHNADKRKTVIEGQASKLNPSNGLQNESSDNYPAIDGLAYDILASTRNLDQFTCVLRLLGVQKEDMSKEELIALVDCAAYSLDQILESASQDHKSLIKSFNRSFPDHLIR